MACGWVSAPWGPAALRSLGATPAEAIGGSLVGAVWVKGLPFAAVGAVAYAARQKPPWVRLLAVGAAFFAVDGFHSTGSAGVPWALLGHSQRAALGVAQLAVVGGVPLLSGFLAAINQAAALAWESRGSRESLRPLAALLAAWAAMALLGLPVAKASRSWLASPIGAPVTLLLVQPNLPRGERWAENLQASHLARVAEYTERALQEPASRPATVLWPENLLTVPVDRSPELSALLEASVDRLGVPVILGAVRAARAPQAHLYRSSVLWLVPGRGIAAALDKTRAVPLVEAQAHAGIPSLLARAFGSPRPGKRSRRIRAPRAPWMPDSA